MLFGCDEYCRESDRPTVDYDSMKHLFPLDRVELGHYGIGVKSLEAITLWATGKPLPPQNHIKRKRIRVFGYEIRITISYKSIK